MKLLEDLYKYIRTFDQGKIVTIAARPGMGKSVFARQIARELNINEGIKVQYIDTLLDKQIQKIGSYEYSEELNLMDIDSVLWKIKFSEMKVVIVDDYQMINKYNKNVSTLLKNIARTYNKTLIVLSNISRQCDRRKDKHPRKRDMTRKVCQSLWKHSDVVMFLYREDYYNHDKKSNILEIDVQKNNKRTAIIEVDFNVLLN